MKPTYRVCNVIGVDWQLAERLNQLKEEGFAIISVQMVSPDLVDRHHLRMNRHSPLCHPLWSIGYLAIGDVKRAALDFWALININNVLGKDQYLT